LADDVMGNLEGTEETFWVTIGGGLGGCPAVGYIGLYF
jgi:hypothetical protein